MSRVVVLMLWTWSACAFRPGVAATASNTDDAPNGSASAIAFDARSQAQITNAATLAWQHTVGDVTNPILLVGASIEKQSAAIVSGITYDGRPLTLARAMTGGNGVRAELWYLIAPHVGTGTITITLSTAVGSDGAIGGAISLSGVNQATPISTTATGGRTSGSPSTSIDVARPDAWLVDVIMIDNGNAVTANAAQLRRWDAQQQICGAGSTLAVANVGSQTMSWSSSSDNWAHVIAEIDP